MKLIVSGGRDRFFDQEDIEWLTNIVKENNVTEIVSGGQTGIDSEGEGFARSLGWEPKVFPADWIKYDYNAGPIRNREMAEYADAVALFSGGKGTASMRKIAKSMGLIVFERMQVNELVQLKFEF